MLELYNKLIKVETTDKFLDLIKIIEVSNNKFIKLKENSHQAVIETDTYIYKIYEDDFFTGKFNLYIREILSEIYFSYNIHWKIINFIRNNKIYTIEQRQKLEVCTKELSCNELLYGWNKTLKILEKKLQLPYIFEQLNNNLYLTHKNVITLKLLRECINKPEDYAFGPNNEIILLDDADWFLGLIDNNYNLTNLKSIYSEVLTKKGMLLFAPMEKKETHLFKNQNELYTKFFIYDDSLKLKESIYEFSSYENKMLNDNLKILCDAPYKTTCEYFDDYTNKLLLNNIIAGSDLN